MFFLTLPSNSSLQYFPKNSLSTYTVKLPESIHLMGDWEVGLCELHYPVTWYNVRNTMEEGYFFELKTKNGVRLEELIKVYNRATLRHLNYVIYYYAEEDDTDVYEFYLKEGQYATEERVIETINEFLKYVSEEHMKLTYNARTKRVVISVGHDVTLSIGRGLAEILGFQCNGKKVAFTEGLHEGDYVVDVKRGLYGLYVYSDIVRPHPVGDVLAPLLRAVPIKEKEGSYVGVKYNPPYFHPLQTKNFSTVTIYIRDDSGKPIPFERGKVVAVLQFMKKS